MRRIKKRNLFIASLFTLLTTGLPGLFFSSAYAASDYDNLVENVSILKAGMPGDPPVVTVSGTSFMPYVSQYCSSTAVDSYLDAVVRGRNYAILQREDFGGFEFLIGLEWQDNTQGDFVGSWHTFDEEYTSQQLRFTSTGGATRRQITLRYSGYYDSWSCNASNSNSSGYITIAQDDRDLVMKPLLSTFDNFTYPTGYAGAYIEDGSHDHDEDGLTMIQEAAQNTSDNYKDTDGDGISDLKESVWFSDRDEVFCKIDPPAANECAYPNPTKQDVYVEIDWMVKGSTPLKPTSTQLSTVVSAFNNQDIKLHFDTGQYGGGEVVPYEEVLEIDPVVGLDFFDYKRGGDGITSGYFNENRYGIWRYMISGDTYNDGNTNTSTGRANLGDDDLFISYDSNLLDDDTAVSGTIMHELGHSLCLSQPLDTYPASLYDYGQDHSCWFEGVHSFAYEDYDSSMSYANQLELVDFSDGSNPSGDHDDWSAVKQFGINDFVEFNSVDPEEPTMFSRNSERSKSHLPEASEEEFRQYQNSLNQ